MAFPLNKMTQPQKYWVDESQFTYVPYFMQGREVTDGLEAGITALATDSEVESLVFRFEEMNFFAQAMLGIMVVSSPASMESTSFRISNTLLHIEKLVKAGEHFAVPLSLTETVSEGDVSIPADMEGDRTYELVDDQYRASRVVMKGMKLSEGFEKKYAVLFCVGPYSNGEPITDDLVGEISRRVGQKPGILLERRLEQLGHNVPQGVYDFLTQMQVQEVEVENVLANKLQAILEHHRRLMGDISQDEI